jgi:hypothetical protein
MEIFMSGGNNPELLKRIYGNDCYKKAVKLWLPFLNKRGFLDCLIVDENSKENLEEKAVE